MSEHRPRMSPDDVERIRAWHERASDELHALGARRDQYLGSPFRWIVPRGLLERTRADASPTGDSAAVTFARR
ncbi:MAG: hypothetical protein AAGA99_21275 [Actinomycetota bacterium]